MKDSTTSNYEAPRYYTVSVLAVLVLTRAFKFNQDKKHRYRAVFFGGISAPVTMLYMQLVCTYTCVPWQPV